MSDTVLNIVLTAFFITAGVTVVYLIYKDIADDVK